MSDGRELKERADARIGTVLHGKYRVDAVLGIGGMGAVFATTHRNQKRFAVKILHPELSLRADIRQRFVREGYVANSLQHPGAVAILDDDVADDGAAFLVMELLEGATVEQVWETMGRRLPPEAVVAIAHQLLATLVAAHEKAIVHRDIKPANLFLQRDGVLKVLDFGIARVKDASAGSVTNTGTLLGTPAFMAPEQAAGEASKVGGETDVWAVGATMFTLLTGSFVRKAESGQQMIIEAATKPARSLGPERPDLPPGLVAIVDRALAFDKNDRWAAATMRDALAEANESLFGGAITRAPLVTLFVEHDARAVPSAREIAQESPPLPLAAGSSLTSPLARTQEPRGALTPAPPSEDLAGRTTAQSVSKAAAQSDKAPPRRNRLRVALPAVGAATLVGTALVVAFLRQHSPPAGGVMPPPIARHEPPAAPPASAVSASPPSRDLQAVTVAVSPPTVSVEVDGIPSAVEGGGVALRGVVGSMHMVRLTSGKSEGTYPVLLTESGAVPSSVALSLSPAPTAKPRETQHEPREKKAEPQSIAPSPSSGPYPPAARTME